MPETLDTMKDLTELLSKNGENKEEEEEKQLDKITFSNGVKATIEEIEAAIAGRDQVIAQLQNIVAEKDKQIGILINNMAKG